MGNIDIDGTSYTPTIKFDFSNGHLLIEGRSIPENSADFYEPLIMGLETYKETPSKSTTVEFKLEYFNTSSSKSLLDVLRKLQAIYDEGNEVSINWYYEEDDDEILEIGEDFSSIVNVPFNIKMVSEN